MKFLITTLLLTFTLIASAENKSSVGVGLLIEDIEISGSKIIPIPRTNYKTPIVLRVVSTEEIDGGFRYTIHAEGLDPGNYDLIKFLKRQDNTPLETDSIPFEVYSVLDAPLTEPQKLTTTKPDSIGGYTTLLWILAIIWIIGLLIILFYKKRTHSSEEIKTPPPTLAEKITALLKESKEKKSDTQNQHSSETTKNLAP